MTHLETRNVQFDGSSQKKLLFLSAAPLFNAADNYSQLYNRIIVMYMQAPKVWHIQYMWKLITIWTRKQADLIALCVCVHGSVYVCAVRWVECISVCMCECTHTYMHVCMWVDVCVCVRERESVRVWAHLCLYTLCSPMYIYICVFVGTCVLVACVAIGIDWCV